MNTRKILITDHITNKKIFILNKELNIIGNDTRVYNIFIPGGINQVQISGNILQKEKPFFDCNSSIVPLIFMTLTDAKGQIIAYANSWVMTSKTHISKHSPVMHQEHTPFS